MAFTRDLGIQFPSDATQASPSSNQAARSAYRYIARGNRYGSQLGKLSGFEYPLGIHFFKNLIPSGIAGGPEPVEYARFIDVRKTKVVDSIKEGLFAEEFRSGLDTAIEVEDQQNFNRQQQVSRVSFPAILTGNVVSSLAQGTSHFYHDWNEAIWNETAQLYVVKNNGLGSDQATQRRAYHAGSDAQLSLPFHALVWMSLIQTEEGNWRASFQADFNGTLLGFINNALDGPTYNARAYMNINELVVNNTTPINRQFDGARYLPATIGDPCLIIVEPQTTLNLWLVVWTETVMTVQCGTPAMSLPLGGSNEAVNDLIFVPATPNAANAIGQAI